MFLSKNFILFLIYFLVFEANANDIDDLRVSSVSHSDGNYHSINPSTKARSSWDDLTVNQIGKPLYMQSPLQQQYQISSGKKSKTTALRSTQAPRLVTIIPDLTAQDSTPTNYNVRNKCRWISSKDMRSVDFDSGEMIIRDSAEQPCYIISIRAFIKFNDDAYFPLRGFKPYPSGAYKIEHFNHSSEVKPENAPYRIPLNCSFPDTGSFLVAHDQRPSDYFLFKEEITVQLDCGYLVLKTKLDYAYQLMLEAISFYQDGDVVSTYRERGPSANAKRVTTSRPVGVKPATMHSEHLVFSTNMTADSGPLIVMPLYSRYICQHRVVLTGNNSIQLVIDRFELNRLITVPNDKLRVDLKHRAHLHSKTECPNPIPAPNLTKMMEASVVRSELTATSNKLTATKSSSTRLECPSLVSILSALLLAKILSL